MTSNNSGQLEQTQTYLIVPLDEARQLIMAQIKESNKLRKSIGSAQSKDEFFIIEEGYRDWREYTADLLKRKLFDTKELYDEFGPGFYDYGFVGTIHTPTNLLNSLEQDHRWLSSLYKRLELFPAQVSQPPHTRDDTGKKLRVMDNKLDALLTSQTVIREDLSELRQAVLARFDASEQTIIAAVVGRLDQSQLAMTQAVLNAVEAGRVPEGELQETLTAVQHALSEIRQQGSVFPDATLASEVERLSEVVTAPKLDAKHKLKVTVPIIPVILSYEGEVELKSGLNLEEVWKRLVTRVRDT